MPKPGHLLVWRGPSKLELCGDTHDRVLSENFKLMLTQVSSDGFEGVINLLTRGPRIR